MKLLKEAGQERFSTNTINKTLSESLTGEEARIEARGFKS